MQIGSRIRELRIAKKMSQGDVETRTGLFRCYTSRVENDYTVPTVDTLVKYARALEIPLYRLFTDDESVKKPRLPPNDGGASWGSRGKGRDELRVLAKALSRMDEWHQKLLLDMAQKLARRSAKR